MGSAARRFVIAAVCAGAVVAVASASGASTSANIGVDVIVTMVKTKPHIVPNGGMATVTKLAFVAGMVAENVGPDAADVDVRIQLPPGLHWGSDLPDPSEHCTSTATTGDCAVGLDPNNLNRSAGWGWDVVADGPGTYVIRVSLVSSSTSDPDTSDNASTVTVVVAPAASGSGAAVAATAARLSPARPSAGSSVVARVGVTAGGAGVRPTRVTCSATVGGVRTAARARAAVGSASCVVPTPRSGHGKALRGLIAFSVGPLRMTRRFGVRLR